MNANKSLSANISSIFKAYDIRGIYPSEIQEDIAFRIGKAFAKFLLKEKKIERRRNALNIVVGRDNRISSLSLFKAFSQGVISEGQNVIDIGLVTTPMLYFATAYYGFDGGVSITASHNPYQYNGFKLVREKAIPISEKSGLRDIKHLVIKDEKHSAKLKKGRIIKKNIINDYAKFVLRFFDASKLKPFRIVIDTANSVSGIPISYVFKKTKIRVFYIFKNLDGRFPNHQPNPLIKRNLKELRKEVREKKADLGVAFDGDGDRVIFIDEKGKPIRPDLITALIADSILEKNSKKKILYDTRSSNIIKEVVEKDKGIPIMGRVGHSFIKEKMRKENITFAGEFSGHYYLRENYFCESPFFVLFKILEALSTRGKRFSQIIKPFQKYSHSGEINFRVKEGKKVLKILEEKYKKNTKGKICKIDGLRIDFEDWWFNARLSHTEPVLRLVVEANGEKLMEKKKKELQELIKKISSQL